MKFSRSIPIKFKRFEKEDIIALWRIVSGVDAANGDAEITIDNGGQEVTSNKEDIFETSRFLKKDIRSIKMRYYSCDSLKRIHLNIERCESRLFSYNKISIEGDSEEWVDAICQKFTDSLDDVRRVPLISIIWTSGGCWVLSVIYCSLGCHFLFDAVAPFVKDITDIFVLRMLLFLVILALAIGFVVWLNKISFMFPSVEIDVNRKLADVRSRTATIFWWVAAALVIPVLIIPGLIRYFAQ